MKPSYRTIPTRKATIKIKNQFTGWLIQDELGYHFVYDEFHVKQSDARPVSLTLPLTLVPFSSKVLFPFFDGLIPDVWLLDMAEKKLKLNLRERMGLLFIC